MVDLSDATIEISGADSYPAPDLIDDQKDVAYEEVKDTMPEISEELDQEVEVTTSSDLNNVDEDETLTNSNSKSDQSELDPSNQDKVLKKPDKILPCPRCKSSNTKFCYYNNYNVNQPRHFCKNCQRYWTSGGTMRNVPVGSGKRKSKHSSNVSTPLQPPVQNEILLKFGENCNELPRSSSDLCEPEAHKVQNGPLPMHPLQGLPGPPWPYTWGPVPWGPPMMFPAPALCPFPIMPALFYYPSLGKHSRDGVNLQGEKIERRKNLWVPKTLRIDDPKEAAKSSIWSTLGIKRDESIKRGSLFQGFNSNNETGGFSSDSARVLHANPAALARSQTFQEIS